MPTDLVAEERVDVTWPSELIAVSPTVEVGFSDRVAEDIEEIGTPGYSDRIAVEELGSDPPVLDPALLPILEVVSSG